MRVSRYLTIFTTRSESSDHYIYEILTKDKPSNKQLDWWLKENACDVNEEDITRKTQKGHMILRQIRRHIKNLFISFKMIH